MEELDRERQVLVEEQRALRLEADVAPLVVGDLAHPRGLVALGLAVLVLGAPFRPLGDVVEVEGGGALGSREGERETRERASERAQPRARAGHTGGGGRHGPVEFGRAVRSAGPRKGQKLQRAGALWDGRVTRCGPSAARASARTRPSPRPPPRRRRAWRSSSPRSGTPRPRAGGRPRARAASPLEPHSARPSRSRRSPPALRPRAGPAAPRGAGGRSRAHARRRTARRSGIGASSGARRAWAAPPPRSSLGSRRSGPR